MRPAVNPASKALWHIETNFGNDLSLDEIAQAAGVSRFHLARIFEARMGRSVMGYVRARRLAIAARALAAGAPDILAVALEAGYGSHEAFTRAFAAAFGVTPEALRQGGTVKPFDLQEAILMPNTLIDTPSPHRLQSGRAMTIGGLAGGYTPETSAAIPSLWQSFVQWLPDVPGRTGEAFTTYGLCYNQTDNSFDYMAGVEVDPKADLPEGFVRVVLKPLTYAVFPHTGHISGIRSTWASIWDKWLPESGLKVLPEPFLEKYGPKFNGMTGEGGLEIWVPVEG
jgi:AraC family transcriptional regulator